MSDSPEISEPQSREANLETELDLKRADYFLRKRELDAKIKGERKSIFLTSPLIIAILSAVFGLLGTGIGAALQGYWNTKLESQKFESSLIQKALETTDKDEAKRNLLFLVKAGLLRSLDETKIERIANNPDDLPLVSRHQAVETGYMSIRRAKQILKDSGFYKGEINDVNDKEFVEAVKKFQAANGLQADGALGLNTAKELTGLE
ncbi:MAG TPA: peptidoglycan-binding domain-containing protein [Pyrinomonadaceae bacterium]|jgi:hypothetical protein|nr:peptidoglycan-binding domain-containing protein [Pyrinomonadaceae bacterium]